MPSFMTPSSTPPTIGGRAAFNASAGNLQPLLLLGARELHRRRRSGRGFEGPPEAGNPEVRTHPDETRDQGDRAPEEAVSTGGLARGSRRPWSHDPLEYLVARGGRRLRAEALPHG